MVLCKGAQPVSPAPGSKEHSSSPRRPARRALAALLWTWQLPQHILGLSAYLLLRVGGMPAGRFKGAWLVYVPGRSGIALGEYIFLSRSAAAGAAAGMRLLQHEYGHTRQSRLLGPLYLPVVGLPSISQAAFSRAARRLGFPGPATRYYRRFPENWADRLGGVRRS